MHSLSLSPCLEQSHHSWHSNHVGGYFWAYIQKRTHSSMYGLWIFVRPYMSSFGYTCIYWCCIVLFLECASLYQVFQNYIKWCSETGHLLQRSSLLRNITRNTKQFSQEMVQLSLDFESKLGYGTMILAFYEEQPTNVVSILDIFEETLCSATRNLPRNTCAQFDQRQLNQ